MLRNTDGIHQNKVSKLPVKGVEQTELFVIDNVGIWLQDKVTSYSCVISDASYSHILFHTAEYVTE